jgi:hypothetical protein
MRLLTLPAFGAMIGALAFASFATTTPASAKTGYKQKQSKTVANRGGRYAQRANRDDFPWHGWAGSFHLDGSRYPGGNPSGPKFAYNNYEGGFHRTAFWVLADRGRY